LTTVPDSVVIHAHLYQPPREDPWTGTVPREPSAAPFHDWNARITHECYRPLTPLLDSLSFDVGATLSEWLAEHAPDVLDAMVRADRASVERLGHGNALAMPYHHVILPLASRRDKEIEVGWGVRDFAARFGRAPAGMWLPETAVDLETLDVLAAAGIAFTILAPHQVERIPLFGRPGVVRTSATRRLAVFVYDGPISHGVAFGRLVQDSQMWFQRLRLPADDVRAAKLVSVATDGETYGHHRAEGIEALAQVIEQCTAHGIRLDNHAAFLARHPPREFVRVVEGSSWSCAHGLERWRSDCGCRVAGQTSQAWRAPLRKGLDELRREIDELLAVRGLTPPDDALACRRQVPADWHARRMFSSCGWFFDDIAGIESRICLAHALRAIELTDEHAERLLAALRARLATAASNDPEMGTGADVIDAVVRNVKMGAYV
jgi:alpha-amylase/alpha-mannosidase (GH57 family)